MMKKHIRFLYFLWHGYYGTTCEMFQCIVIFFMCVYNKAALDFGELDVYQHRL